MYGVSHEGKYCTFNKILVRKAQISVESYLVYQSMSQKSILCDVYFKGHLEIRKNENKTQIYLIRLESVFEKNTKWLNP
jgi:hypothetical protein